MLFVCRDMNLLVFMDYRTRLCVRQEADRLSGYCCVVRRTYKWGIMGSVLALMVEMEIKIDTHTDHTAMFRHTGSFVYNAAWTFDLI